MAGMLGDVSVTGSLSRQWTQNKHADSFVSPLSPKKRQDSRSVKLRYPRGKHIQHRDGVADAMRAGLLPSGSSWPAGLLDHDILANRVEKDWRNPVILARSGPAGSADGDQGAATKAGHRRQAVLRRRNHHRRRGRGADPASRQHHLLDWRRGQSGSGEFVCRQAALAASRWSSGRSRCFVSERSPKDTTDLGYLPGTSLPFMEPRSSARSAAVAAVTRDPHFGSGRSCLVCRGMCCRRLRRKW